MGFGKIAHNLRWAGGVVPFVIDSKSFPPLSAEAAVINAATAEWNAKTALKLVPHTMEADYVFFEPNQQACNSPVGRVGGGQRVACALFPPLVPMAGLAAAGQGAALFPPLGPMAGSASDQVDAFYVDASGAVRVSWVSGSGRWQGPIAITSAGFARPGASVAVGIQNGDQLDVFVVDQRGAVYVMWVSGTAAW